MLRALVPFIKAYAVAVLPIAIVMAGVTWIENLMNPYVPLSDQEWDLRFAVWEVFIITYVIAFAYALPMFALLRWAAGKRGWLNYKIAIAGGVLAGLSFPLQAVMFNNLGQGKLGLAVVIFGVTGAVCGAVYWWCERRFTHSSDPHLNQGLLS